MENRRLTRRFTLMSPMTYRATVASGRGFLVSLSQAGCTLETDTAFALHDPVTLLFHLGLVDPVVAIATVRWAYGTRSGAEFVCMSAGCQERLREWLIRRANGMIAGYL
ncbi:MAG TPA: PilZ domain-containing protein [Nitrospiraceae bacterium]|nr:PilZ domain-containing protein [Nitrospiraceae bacterium]